MGSTGFTRDCPLVLSSCLLYSPSFPFPLQLTTLAFFPSALPQQDSFIQRAVWLSTSSKICFLYSKCDCVCEYTTVYATVKYPSSHITEAVIIFDSKINFNGRNNFPNHSCSLSNSRLSIHMLSML